MYWWHILHVQETEMIHRVYNAQKYQTRKKDWINQIVEDKKSFDIGLSDDEVKNMTKNIFKNIIEKKNIQKTQAGS